jgi:hypothetical protein
VTCLSSRNNFQKTELFCRAMNGQYGLRGPGSKPPNRRSWGRASPLEVRLLPWRLGSLFMLLVKVWYF